MILIKKREQRDLTRKVICDCGCGKTFHPFKYRKAERNFLNTSHYAKYKKKHHIGGHAKLTPDQVRKIYAFKGKVPILQVAEHYGVSQGTVDNIWYGFSWNHITHNK